jgi:hypothetical protein
MKVGSLVYATDSGLGILAKSFYDNGIITRSMVVSSWETPNPSRVVSKLCTGK